MAELDHYDVLGVDPNASPADIKAAFRKLAKERHPDLSAAEDAAEQFRQLNLSYAVLSDAERREHFDWLRSQRPAQPPKPQPKSPEASASSDDLRGEGRRRRAYRHDVARKIDEHGRENVAAHASWIDDLDPSQTNETTNADKSRVTLYVAVTLLLVVTTLLLLAK